jgi:hypothetical protein
MVSRHVPESIKRALYQEAGYRCAIPTCGETSALTMDHIEDWADVQKHDVHNMIILCANCHLRKTNGEIPPEALRAYKKNLVVINGRYTLQEVRLVKYAFENKKEITNNNNEIPFIFWDGDLITYAGLRADEIIIYKHMVHITAVWGAPEAGHSEKKGIKIEITEKGWDFIAKFMGGQEVV